MKATKSIDEAIKQGFIVVRGYRAYQMFPRIQVAYERHCNQNNLPAIYVYLPVSSPGTYAKVTIDMLYSNRYLTAAGVQSLQAAFDKAGARVTVDPTLTMARRLPLENAETLARELSTIANSHDTTNSRIHAKGLISLYAGRDSDIDKEE